jgi:hypothetical protein
MNKEKLHQLTTMADRLHRTFENGDIVNPDDVEHFVNGTVGFLESIGGRVHELQYVSDNVLIHGYVDQLIDNTDGKNDKFGSCWFIVPREWATREAQSEGFENLEVFFDEYIYDNVDGWLQKAVDDGVLQGAGIGMLSL